MPEGVCGIAMTPALDLSGIRPMNALPFLSECGLVGGLSCCCCFVGGFIDLSNFPPLVLFMKQDVSM